MNRKCLQSALMLFKYCIFQSFCLNKQNYTGASTQDDEQIMSEFDWTLKPHPTSNFEQQHQARDDPASSHRGYGLFDKRPQVMQPHTPNTRISFNPWIRGNLSFSRS